MQHHFGAAFVLMVFLSLIAPRSLAYLPLVFGTLLSLYFYARCNARPCLPRAGSWIVSGLVGWILLSSLWALDPATSLERAVKIGITLGGGLFWIALSRPIPRKWLQALVGLYIGAGLVLAVECYGQMPISRFLLQMAEGEYLPRHSLNRGCVILSLLLAPILALARNLWGDRKSACYGQAVIILSLFTGLSRCDSQTAQLAAIIGLILFYGTFLYRRWLWLFLSATIAVYCLSAPFAAIALHDKMIGPALELPFLKAGNAAPRMEIWNFVALKALEKPWLGHGIEATRFMKADHWMKNMNADTALHPHNAALQAWVEFGFAGALALTAFLLFLLARCRAMAKPVAQRTALATLMAAFCVLNTGYGVWQGWQLGLIVLLFSLMAVIARQNAPVRYS